MKVDLPNGLRPMSDRLNAPDNQHPLDRQEIVQKFAELKLLDNYADVIARSLRLPAERGYLAPVCELHAEDQPTIALLTAIRAGVTTFPSQFAVTPERTRKWLRTLLLDVPDRLLFFVLNRAGHIVGHAGFTHCDNDAGRMEVDNVVRAKADIEPGLMSAALQRLCEWAEETFKPREIYLRVLEDNTHAIRFYERLGFRGYERQPLRRVESADEVNFVPRPANDNDPPDRMYLVMRREK